MKEQKKSGSDTNRNVGKVRDIVLPGEFIDEKKGRRVGKGAYFEGDKVFAKVLGIPIVRENQISVIPLSGAYIPSINDTIIGICLVYTSPSPRD